MSTGAATSIIFLNFPAVTALLYSDMYKSRDLRKVGVV